MCAKHYIYVRIRINISLSKCLLPRFSKLGVTRSEILVWCLTGAFCFLFHVEATPLADVDTPFATFCTSWFLGMWPLFLLQWAAEGTRQETDRVGRSAWEVERVCSAHTATKFKLKDVNPNCCLSTRTLVPDLIQRCYFDKVILRAEVTEIWYSKTGMCLICRVNLS
jgi:hypothetical protein